MTMTAMEYLELSDYADLDMEDLLEEYEDLDLEDYLEAMAAKLDQDMQSDPDSIAVD